MSGGASKWADLGPRMGSAAVMVVIGLLAIWVGGVVFGALVAFVTGLIGWEITRMIAPDRDVLAAALGAAMGAAVFLAGFLPGGMALLLLFFTVMMGAGALGAKPDRVRFMLYGLYAMVAGFALTAFHAQAGLVVILWLVALVVATDILGYFAGRILGGPKFWPAVSPKKTWSGTIAGWMGAALVGLAFAPWLGGHVIWLSVILSFGSQMGDAAESALKRHTGIKDSSNLIPGHGGAFDRFDALLGATFCLYLAHLCGLWG
ncbi:phosphatidate cytidylyltransferase [Aliiroseovarius subalbicans]|uniref:phosphatidate cytidylyltransferase n=1 Tax=Aliiroseovarius subalbicans TaxID=2925840 RepID=UPI001F55FE36|nr:phosphatidate cytidylyltransferase [Aliiroseovarius subalbicans]MCI2398366.1 phosphatidate cytidylyltransferase [Aliiroseovarius subalbicans]